MPPWYFFTGVAVFLVGYLPGLLVPVYYGNYNPDASSDGRIPLAGPMLMRAHLSDHALYKDGWDAITIADSIVQWIGFAGIAAGTVVAIVGRDEAPAKRAEIDLNFMLAPNGAGVRVTW